MSLYLRVFVILVSLVFVAAVFRMVRHEKVLLKYALFWSLLGVAGVLVAVFPGIAYWASGLLGFETPVNFVFLVIIVLLMGISMVYGVALSKQAEENRVLIQELSLIKSRMQGHVGVEAQGEQLASDAFDDDKGLQQ